MEFVGFGSELSTFTDMSSPEDSEERIALRANVNIRKQTTVLPKEPVGRTRSRGFEKADKSREKF